LRRLIKDDPNPPRTDPDAALTRVPRGGVIRPEEDYEYLAEVDRYIAATASPPLPLGPETGIALATAFDTADVTLTSLGATMRLDWRGEPAILKSTNAVPLPDSFSLERLFYQAWLGRDVRVIAVDKGYLLPFGVRASYLTVSERVFLPGVRGPVAKEIQRRFITVARAPKRFPAVNQPDGGRDFPASLLTMLTTRTPDLVKPVDEATGRIVVDHPGAGPDWAFWPRFRAQSGLMDVEWKSLVDEDNTPLVNNMIFILNAAAANQDFVAKVVRYYNGALRESDPGRRDTWPPRNVAKLGGARRSYAPRADTARPMRGRSQADTPAPPDTAFDTESWLLVVRGRSSGSGDPTGKDDNFVMDARMNGADQPPFYPSLRRAAIGVQSIDRLVGKPQGLIETQPYRPYVTGGFDAGNKGEIYLEVMWPLISLNPAAAERPAAGGVAQPDTKVAAFSRVSGIVGGTEGKQKAVPGVVRALVEQPRLYFSKAAEGKFNPEEFFKLKVFGLDLLKGIEVDLDLGNAPRLSELVDYGASQVRQDQIQEAARRARTVVVNARAAIDRGIVQFNDDIDDVAPGVTFATLYPELMKAYGDATDTLIAELDVVANQGDLQIVATAAMKISAAAKPLMIEISRVTRDPLPPAVNTAIAEIIGEWRKFEGLIRNLPATIEAELRAFVNAQVAELDRLSADYLALLFGLQGGETILDLVRNPDARARLGETLFYEQFGERILQMLHAVERFVIELGGAAAIARERVREAAEAAIHAELQALAGQLSDDLVMTASNILREQDVERLAVALADAVDQTVRTLTAAPDLTQALVRLQQVKAELGGGAARQQIDQAIKAQIEARKAWIVAVDPAEQARLYALFAAAVAAAALNEAVLVATEAVDRVITAVDARLHSGFDAFVAIALDALNATLDGATALHDLARVAELGRTTINGWCTDAAGGVLRTVKALGNGVLALKADIDAAITGVASAVSAIQPPGTVSAPILARFEAIRSALLRSVQVAADASAELDAAREALKTMSGAATCAATADFAQALGKAIAERSESVAALRGMTVQISALQRLIREAPGHNDDFKNAVEPHLARMVHDARVLIGGLSVVGKVDLAGIWHDEIAAAKDKVRQAIGLSGFQTRLDESYSRLVREGTAIRNALVSASAEELAGLVESTVALAEWDRRFAGLIVETVALGDGARAKVEAVALAMLNGAARHLLTLHVEAYGPLVQLRDHIAGYPTVIYLLGTEYANFVTAVSDVDRDIKLLRDLAGAPDFPKAVISLKALKDQWDGKTLALTRAVRAIASFIDAFLKGQLGRLLAERVREQFALLERTLREMIAEFVPARITTRYDWNTTIGDVSGGFFNFAMRPPRSDKDLEIKSIIEFNFLSGRRNAIIEGTLKPFKVQLPGLFTLFFREATFKSENGSDPAFKVDLEDIALEKSLQFLESLRSIFAPSGNGFYIQPSLRRLKVGYGFARDYATVGSLTLSNIALDIYVELPFGKDPVCFGFLFASKEKPFLISNPPYGGGGWVRILFETNKKPDIALSFMFGAVTDIQFGPLRGQGRICAGIWWENDELTAFVEAVGEGSIACFSISILIGIYLTYRPSDGAMYGKARYEFKFKVGFVTFKYKVEAAYRIRGSQQGAGGSGSGGGFAAAAAAVALMPAQALLAAVGLDGPGTHVHTTKVPPKSFKWRDYSAYVALELLDD
jgi:hypothetical protein